MATSRRENDPARPLATTRDPEPPPSAAFRIGALQRTVGNAAVARLLDRGPSAGPLIARTLDERLTLPPIRQAPVTPARLREIFASFEDAWGRMSADPVQVSYADEARVNEKRVQFRNELTAALATIAQDGPADPESVGVAFAEAEAGATDLAKQLGAALKTLASLVGSMNKAWDAWNSDRSEQEARRLEEQALQDEISQFKLRDKEESAKGKERMPVAPEGDETEDDESINGFPHNGKHAPKKKWLTEAKLKGPAFPEAILMDRTAVKGNVAVYKTRDPVTVVGWETEARKNGLELSDNFTVVHGFDEDIGADHGEMTRFVRIDGDHGHPISEDYEGLKTSFTSYVKKDVIAAKEAGDAARLRRIYDFLLALKLVPARFGIKSEPPKA